MRWIVCLAMSLIISPASQASDFYTDAGITANAIDVGQVIYRPVTLRAKLGYILAPYYSIETRFATHVYKSDKENQPTVGEMLWHTTLKFTGPVP